VGKVTLKSNDKEALSNDFSKKVTSMKHYNNDLKKVIQMKLKTLGKTLSN
jgi:predicted negative regulator of RcsB-dependent stress response